MGLEVEKPDMKPDDLNANWPEGTDGIKYGDNHLRIVKLVIKNLWKTFTTWQTKIEGYFDNGVAKDSKLLGGEEPDKFAKVDGTYDNLRAKATTKEDVGLGSVGNFGISDATDSNSSVTYASSKAVKDSTSLLPIANINQIGSYGFMRYVSAIGPGGTVAGSQLRFTGVQANRYGGQTPSGTWRAMGNAGLNAATAYNATLFVRIS